MQYKNQEFYYDSNSDEYYIVNFQEKTYIKIAYKGSIHYDVFRHLYCSRDIDELKELMKTFKKCNYMWEMDGSQEPNTNKKQ